MSKSIKKILNLEELRQKIRRLAYQIYEDNFEEEELVFAGIHEMGYRLAEQLQTDFAKIAQKKTVLTKIQLDKLYPVQSEVKVSCDLASLSNKIVIIVDDVLNTGRTLAYSLKPFLDIRVKKLQTVVLVDRKHHHFPISADFVGLALATTIQEHIEVILDGSTEETGVFLS